MDSFEVCFLKASRKFKLHFQKELPVEWFTSAASSLVDAVKTTLAGEAYKLGHRCSVFVDIGCGNGNIMKQVLLETEGTVNVCGWEAHYPTFQ